MKKTLLFYFALLSLNSFGQTLTLDDLEGKELNNKIRLNYILISPNYGIYWFKLQFPFK